jgi:hypothetical protein
MINVPGVVASSSNNRRFPQNRINLRKYVNPNEVEKGIELIVQLRQVADISGILVITPVSYEGL